MLLNNREDCPNEQHPNRIDSEQYRKGRCGESPIVQPGVKTHCNRLPDIESQRIAVIGNIRFIVADIVRQHDVVMHAEHRRRRLQENDQQIRDASAQRKIRPLQQKRRQRSDRHIHENSDEKDSEAHQSALMPLSPKGIRENRKRPECIKNPNRKAECPNHHQQQIGPRGQDQSASWPRKGNH